MLHLKRHGFAKVDCWCIAFKARQHVRDMLTTGVVRFQRRLGSDEYRIEFVHRYLTETYSRSVLALATYMPVDQTGHEFSSCVLQPSMRRLWSDGGLPSLASRILLLAILAKDLLVLVPANFFLPMVTRCLRMGTCRRHVWMGKIRRPTCGFHRLIARLPMPTRHTSRMWWPSMDKHLRS